MMFRNIVAVLALASTSMAFSARSVTQAKNTVLFSTMPAMSEQDALRMMTKARECAFSDSCSIEESREHLRDVLNIQVACASGTVAGHDVCDNVQEVSEIVARLREHVNTGKHGLTTKQQGLSAAAAVPVAFVALALATMVAAPSDPNVVPFTAQEIGWAIRDGYLGELISHGMKHGGLLVGDASPAVVPFTAQEVGWAIRDGYLGELLSHGMKHGGLLVGDAPDKLSFQEMGWAIRDGYFDDLVSHYLRNGGMV
jgi:hypothetical protein